MQGTIDVQIGSVTTSVLVELLSTDHFASSAGHPDDSSGGQSSDPTVLYTFNVNKYVYLPLLVSFFCGKHIHEIHSEVHGLFFDRRPIIIHQKWVVACPADEAITSNDDDCQCAAYKSSDDSSEIVHGVGLFRIWSSVF